MRPISISCLTLAVAALLAAPLAADEFRLLPSEFLLSGPHAQQRIIAQRYAVEESIGPAMGELRWASSNPQVAVVEEGRVLPRGEGECTITATDAEGRQAEAKATVRNLKQPPAISFRNQVLPVLTKAGCNMGACHGALAGKGGFRLSLRGYDPASDYRTITKQARGRRIELGDPGRSLILAKPSAAIPHKGGLRLDVDSADYDIVAEWIATAAPGPRADDPVVERLSIDPPEVTLAAAGRQPFVVRAHYSDGSVVDATRWTKFSSADETVATIDADGTATVVGHGAGAVVAWFSSKIVVARIRVPYPNDLQAQTFAQAPRRNFIDTLVLDQLQRLNLPPAARCDDATFIRRAYLDTIGTLPTPDETRAFLADEAADKRDRLIDDLLKRPEFVDYWTYKWSDLLLINGRKLRPAAVKAYYQWIRGHVEKNTPWDAFVRELVTAQGSSVKNGATNFYALHQDPESMAENVSQAFLGLSIGCAKCHNHPLEKWTNDQYYAMANLFARVRAKGWGGDSRSGDGVRTLFVAGSGELIQPRTGKPQPPTPLDGQPLAFDDPSDRRLHLAAWLTDPENPYFTRAITNRVWANFFGVGLIEPVDDLRMSNPASNEQLLAAAADYLIEQDYDLKALMREILRSETYQRSSVPASGSETERRHYSRYYPRRLMAEVLLDANSQVTGVPSRFTEIEFPGADVNKTDFYPPGTRAIQLYDSAVRNYFLRAFGRHSREITCECERSDEPSMVQVLHLSNGSTLNKKLQAADGQLSKWLASDLGDSELLDEAFLAALSRRPTSSERQKLLPLLQADAPQKKRVLLEDLLWSLMTSREFLFNH